MSDSHKQAFWRFLRFTSYAFCIFTIVCFCAVLCVPNMRSHFTNLLYRWIIASTRTVGTNPLGFVLLVADAIVFFFVTLAYAFHLSGSHGMLTELRKDALRTVSFAVITTAIIYVPVFIWVGIQTVYDDHQTLVSANSTLKAENKRILQGQSTNETGKRRLEIRTKLAGFLDQAASIKALCLSQLTHACEARTHHLLQGIVAYISKNLEPSYRARFESAGGALLSYPNMTQYQNENLSLLKYKTEALEQFIKELMN